MSSYTAKARKKLSFQDYEPVPSPQSGAPSSSTSSVQAPGVHRAPRHVSRLTDGPLPATDLLEQFNQVADEQKRVFRDVDVGIRINTLVGILALALTALQIVSDAPDSVSWLGIPLLVLVSVLALVVLRITYQTADFRNFTTVNLVFFVFSVVWIPFLAFFIKAATSP